MFLCKSYRWMLGHASRCCRALGIHEDSYCWGAHMVQWQLILQCPETRRRRLPWAWRLRTCQCTCKLVHACHWGTLTMRTGSHLNCACWQYHNFWPWHASIEYVSTSGIRITRPWTNLLNALVVPSGSNMEVIGIITAIVGVPWTLSRNASTHALYNLHYIRVCRTIWIRSCLQDVVFTAKRLAKARMVAICNLLDQDYEELCSSNIFPVTCRAVLEATFDKNLDLLFGQHLSNLISSAIYCSARVRNIVLSFRKINSVAIRVSPHIEARTFKHAQLKVWQISILQL
jgi:hypothetical protein